MLTPLTPATALQLLTPSARVLVASAHPSPPSVESLPWDEVHWPTLVALMTHERAEVPVSRLLRQLGGRVPAEVRTATEGLERVAQFRSALLGDAATAAVGALAGAGVPALWLKGAALAMQRPEGFAVRAMGDLDLLVAREDLSRARAALQAIGWSPTEADGYDGHHHDAPMVHAGGLRLELHTQLFPDPHPFTSAGGAAWLARGVDATWQGTAVRVLPASWHVVHAALHWGWSHVGMVGTWQYLHDLHRLTAGWVPEGPEWDAVVRHAGELQAGAPVGWALWLARQLGVASTSESAIRRLRGRRRVLDGMVERQWVLSAMHSTAASPSVGWSRFWWTRGMRGLGRPGDRWPWLAGRAGALPAGATGAEARAAGWGDGLARWRRHLLRIARS